MTTQVPRATVATLVSVAAIVAANLPATAQKAPVPTPVSSYHIVNIYPHDRRAFTQGLQYVNGVLYEGTGLTGQSTIRKVKLENGEVLQEHKTDPRHFGEGIVVWKGLAHRVSPGNPRSGSCTTSQPSSSGSTFNYTGEGWGLTHDGARLIMSDGSSSLRFLDPATLRETGRMTVRTAPRR